MKSLLKNYIIRTIFVFFLFLPNQSFSSTVDNASLSPSSATIQTGELQTITFSVTNDKTFDIRTYHAEFKYTAGLTITNISTSPSAIKTKLNSKRKLLVFEWENIGQGATLTATFTVSSQTAGTYSILPTKLYYRDYKRKKAYKGTCNKTTITIVPAPDISLFILSPVDGDIVSKPKVMVRGTVINASGNETGVTVNGIIATVYNGGFVANNVTLEEGENAITATAVDINGNSATTSIAVTAETTIPHIILRGNIESGIPPLTTHFSISTYIPNPLTTYEMDFEGDGVIDYTGTTFENISYTYTSEGIFYPTVTAVDEQDNTYADTIVVVVHNKADLDSFLKDKWLSMTINLSVRDTATALTYIHPASKEAYEEMFTLLYEQLPYITATQLEFNLIHVIGYVAKYELVTLEDNKMYSHEVTFIKDENGIWTIMQY